MAGRRRWPRMLGYGLGALVLLLVILYVVASSRVDSTLAKRYTMAAATLPPPDSTSMARGAHLVEVLGCNVCHGRDLGGTLMVDAPPFRLESINLTRGTGGVGAQLTPAVFEHAMRHGVGHDGRPLVVMPDYGTMADADVVALHTYIASLPPVNRTSGGVVVKPMGKMIFGLSGLPDFDPARFTRQNTFTAHAPSGATADHGRYLAHITCVHCHGADLKGAQPGDPDSPLAPSLEPSSRWSEAQFRAALHEGTRPSGPRLDSLYMPWTSFRHLTGEEVQAVQAFLKEHFGAAARAGG